MVCVRQKLRALSERACAFVQTCMCVGVQSCTCIWSACISLGGGGRGRGEGTLTKCGDEKEHEKRFNWLSIIKQTKRLRSCAVLCCEKLVQGQNRMMEHTVPWYPVLTKSVSTDPIYSIIL